MRVLIIGSDSALGIALEKFLAQRGRNFVSLPQAECNWKSERQAKKVLRRADCGFVVDTRLQAASDAGIRIYDTDVERCGWLAASCQALKSPYVFLSSAAVFSGTADEPYSEDRLSDSESTLAALLLQAEALVREKCEPSVVLRMGSLFAPHGVNVITHMMEQLHGAGHLVVGRHRLGCPVPVEDAARVVSGMLDQLSCGVDRWGFYHYCSSDVTNCYEFGEVLLAAASQYEEFPLDATLLVETSELGEETNLELDCNKIRNTFAIKQQPWRVSVAGYIKQYYAAKAEETADDKGYRQ